MATKLNTTQLQIALCSLGSGVPDGVVGSKTRSAILRFSELMVIDNTEAEVQYKLKAIFDQYAPSFSDVKCKCGNCSGYGNGLHDGEYRDGKHRIEAYYNYEYPGISSLTVWATVLIQAMFEQYDFRYSSGYRCWNDNHSHRRKSTNHMGKALDLRPNYDDPDKRQCVANDVRTFFSQQDIQIGWARKNALSFEPGSIAPTWIHTDCRCFDRKYINSTIDRI